MPHPFIYQRKWENFRQRRRCIDQESVRSPGTNSRALSSATNAARDLKEGRHLCSLVHKWLGPYPYLKGQLALQVLKKSNVTVAQSQIQLKFKAKSKSIWSKKKRKKIVYMKNVTDKNTPSSPLGINKSFIRKKEKSIF